MEHQRPTLKNKLGFALGHVMNDMCASMWFTYLLLYFHKVIEFDNIYAGVLLFIGKYMIYVLGMSSGDLLIRRNFEF